MKSRSAMFASLRFLSIHRWNFASGVTRRASTPGREKARSRISPASTARSKRQSIPTCCCMAVSKANRRNFADQPLSTPDSATGRRLLDLERFQEKWSPLFRFENATIKKLWRVAAAPSPSRFHRAGRNAVNARFRLTAGDRVSAINKGPQAAQIWRSRGHIPAYPVTTEIRRCRIATATPKTSKYLHFSSFKA